MLRESARVAANDQDEIDRLGRQGWYFCETPDCPVYGPRDDLIQQAGGPLLCPTHDREGG